MALSKVTLLGDGVTNTFTVNFALGYIDIADVTCRVGNEVDGLLAPVYRTITPLTPSLLQISGAPPGNGVEVVFERTVSATALKVDFQDDKVLSELTLNTAQKQALMLAHQALDGRLAVRADALDMGNYKIINVANGTDPLDVVNKGQLDAVTAAAGNVPVPGAPNVGQFLKATAASVFSWASIVAADILNSTAIGRTLLTAADAAAVRVALSLPTLFVAKAGDSMAGNLAVTGNVSATGTISGATVSGNGSGLLGVNNAGHNFFINPNFDIWQFGTSVTPPLTTFTYFADGWMVFAAGAAGSVSRQGGTYPYAPGFRNGDGVILASVASNAYVDIAQRIEARRVNAGLRGFVCVSGYLFNNTGAVIPQIIMTASTPSATDNWAGFTQRDATTQTLNIAAGATVRVQWVFDNSALTDSDKGLMINFRVPNLTAGTGVVWSGMKIERVATSTSIATDVEPKSFANILADCQRYYEKSFPLFTFPAQNVGTALSEIAMQTVGASTLGSYPVAFKVTKRAVPTMTYFNPSAANAQIRNTGANADFTGTATVAANERLFIVQGTSPAATANTQNVIFHWVADARL